MATVKQRAEEFIECLYGASGDHPLTRGEALRYAKAFLEELHKEWTTPEVVCNKCKQTPSSCTCGVGGLG